MKKERDATKLIGRGLILITLLTFLNLFLAAGGIQAHRDQGRQEDIEFVVIDGCQYLGRGSSDGITIYAHRGNCTNSVHVYNSSLVSTNSVVKN